MRRYDGGSATSLAVDKFGNVYVTGDGGTVKYDAAGNQLWVRESGHYLGVDALGNIYITGGLNGSQVTIKYDATGKELWTRERIGLQNSIALDVYGNVYLTGVVFGETDASIETIKYDTNGNEVWRSSYIVFGFSWDFSNAFAIDALGNVYVAVKSVSEIGKDFTMIKYNAKGEGQWVKKNGNTWMRYISVDNSGNVYVAGSSAGVDSRPAYVTIKYVQASPPVVDAGTDKTLYLGYGSNCVTLTAKASEGSAP